MDTIILEYVRFAVSSIFLSWLNLEAFTQFFHYQI